MHRSCEEVHVIQHSMDCRDVRTEPSDQLYPQSVVIIVVHVVFCIIIIFIVCVELLLFLKALKEKYDSARRIWIWILDITHGE